MEKRRFLIGSLRVTVRELGRGRPKWSNHYHSKYEVEVAGSSAVAKDIYWRMESKAHRMVADLMVTDLYAAHFYPDDYIRDFFFDDMTDQEKRRVQKWAEAFVKEAGRFNGDELKEAYRGMPPGPREWMPER